MRISRRLANAKIWASALLAASLGACAGDPAPETSATPATPPIETIRPVSAAMLLDPAPGDWLQWGRTYDGQNFSPLTRINRSNVSKLTPAWRAPLKAGSSMPTPLVHDGIMFLQTAPDT